MNGPCDAGEDSIIRCVFASPDLVFNILRPLIDGDPSTTSSLLKLATVSKSFHDTILSNQFWCDICYQRWKTKWGFRIRWNKALSDYNSLIIDIGNEESHDKTTHEINSGELMKITDTEDDTKMIIEDNDWIKVKKKKQLHT